MRRKDIAGGIDSYVGAGALHQVHDEFAPRDIGIGVADPADTVLKCPSRWSAEDTECSQLRLNRGSFYPRPGGGVQAARSAGCEGAQKISSFHLG